MSEVVLAAHPSSLGRSRTKVASFVRLFLIATLFLAFARLTWQLDAKSLWIDEAFSLERVQGSWYELLVGHIMVTDGLLYIPTTDQHPFAYFVLLGAWVRLAGSSEFMLRFPSVWAATLIVPTVWVLAKLLVRQRAAPPTTAYWAILLASASPFYLWYGQEVRMYMLWAFLAALSTYTLLRWQEAESRGAERRWLGGYLLVLAGFVLTQYYSVLLLPVHALIVFQRLLGISRWKAAVVTAGILGGALVLGLIAIWQVFSTPSSGSNFASISLRMIIPDLVNAFSLGLSVDLAQVWWLDLLFGIVALLGMAWTVRQWPERARLGWFLPVSVLIPVLLILAINLVRPAYMNARHISLISAGFLILVAAGVAWLWQARSWLGAAMFTLLLAGMGYSTHQYYFNPDYGKGELAALGAYVHQEFKRGDWLFVNPASAFPLYRYYLPVEISEGISESGWTALPLLHQPASATEALLESVRQQHPRIWLVAGDPSNAVGDWLRGHAFQVRDIGFASPISWLRVQLFISELPVYPHPFPHPIQHPLDVLFGDGIRLIGYDIGEPIAEGSVMPVTLYWQAAMPMEQRYKYKLSLEDRQTGEMASFVAEREPYDGFLPTNQWPLEHTIVEQTEILATANPPPGRYRLRLSWYDVETFELLTITRAGDLSVIEDEKTLLLPFPEK
jgi:mannosyltransferase